MHGLSLIVSSAVFQLQLKRLLNYTNLKGLEDGNGVITPKLPDTEGIALLPTTSSHTEVKTSGILYLKYIAYGMIWGRIGSI